MTFALFISGSALPNLRCKRGLETLIHAFPAFLCMAARSSAQLLLYPVGDRLKGDEPLARFGFLSERIARGMRYFTSAPVLLKQTNDVVILQEHWGRMLAESAPLALIPLQGVRPTRKVFVSREWQRPLE